MPRPNEPDRWLVHLCFCDTFVLLLKMATAVRTCGALARSAVASNSLVRVGCHLNRPAIPVSLLIRKLSTTPIRKLRSEKEITDWVEKEMSKVRIERHLPQGDLPQDKCSKTFAQTGQMPRDLDICPKDRRPRQFMTDLCSDSSECSKSIA